MQPLFFIFLLQKGIFLMKEIVLEKKKNGMIVLIFTILSIVASCALTIYGGVQAEATNSLNFA